MIKMSKNVAKICMGLSSVALIVSQPLLVSAENIITPPVATSSVASTDIILAVILTIVSLFGLIHLNRDLYLRDYKYNNKK